jgi:hypothetical protein
MYPRLGVVLFMKRFIKLSLAPSLLAFFLLHLADLQLRLLTWRTDFVLYQNHNDQLYFFQKKFHRNTSYFFNCYERKWSLLIDRGSFSLVKAELDRASDGITIVPKLYVASSGESWVVSTDRKVVLKIDR